LSLESIKTVASDKYPSTITPSEFLKPLTLVEPLAVPHVSEKVLEPVAVIVTCSDPEDALAPDQEPEAIAEHEVLLEVQVKVVEDPTKASEALDEIVRVGAPPPPPPPPHDEIIKSAGRIRYSLDVFSMSFLK